VDYGYDTYNPYDDPSNYYPNGAFNWQHAGLVNTNYNATNANVNANSDQHQNVNPFADPNSAAPNFNGNVTVDTASLNAFGQWVKGEVYDTLQQLQTPLTNVNVQPGDFYWADYVRAYVNGTTNGTGLAGQFKEVITHLLDGLSGISDGIDQLVQLYGSTEDLNSAQVANLEADMSNSFSNAYSYFNTLGTDSQSPNIAPQS
jgi:hypothetical protein